MDVTDAAVVVTDAAVVVATDSAVVDVEKDISSVNCFVDYKRVKTCLSITKSLITARKVCLKMFL